MPKKSKKWSGLTNGEWLALEWVCGYLDDKQWEDGYRVAKRGDYGFNVKEMTRIRRDLEWD